MGTVTSADFLGHLMRCAVDVGRGLSVHAGGSSQAPFTPGNPAHVTFPFDSALALPLDDGDDLVPSRRRSNQARRLDREKDPS